VGDHQQTLAARPQVGEQPQDLARGPAVEVAGGLVGQDQQGVVDQGSGQRHPLALAPGQPVGQVVAAIRDIQPLEQLDGPATGPARRGPDEQGRQLDVLDRGELVDQVETLEHEADRPAAQDRPGGLGQPVDAAAVEDDLPGVGAIEPAQQMEQRRLAAAAGAHHRHGLAGLYRQVDPVDRTHRHSVGRVGPGQPRGLDNGAATGSAHRVLQWSQRCSHTSSQRMSAWRRRAAPSSSRPPWLSGGSPRVTSCTSRSWRSSSCR